jgi:hypothetical protein
MAKDLTMGSHSQLLQNTTLGMQEYIFGYCLSCQDKVIENNNINNADMMTCYSADNVCVVCTDTSSTNKLPEYPELHSYVSDFHLHNIIADNI